MLCDTFVVLRSALEECKEANPSILIDLMLFTCFHLCLALLYHEQHLSLFLVDVR